MKSTSRGSDIYKINDILVTGNHMIFNSMRGWIRARDHPSSEYIDDYRKEFVYCVSTTTKTIKIKDLIFADWDEIDEEDMTEIRKIVVLYHLTSIKIIFTIIMMVDYIQTLALIWKMVEVLKLMKLM